MAVLETASARRITSPATAVSRSKRRDPDLRPPRRRRDVPARAASRTGDGRDRGQARSSCGRSRHAGPSARALQLRRDRLLPRRGAVAHPHRGLALRRRRRSAGSRGRGAGERGPPSTAPCASSPSSGTSAEVFRAIAGSLMRRKYDELEGFDEPIDRLRALRSSGAAGASSPDFTGAAPGPAAADLRNHAETDRRAETAGLPLLEKLSRLLEHRALGAGGRDPVPRCSP